MTNILIRFFDILLSILMLIILSPLSIIISLLILLFNGQPIIFKQTRIGYKGTEFKLLKFRTMHNLFVKNESLRVTALGKVLRKTSLDEIPQFINVLKKDMSIVGPRPLPKKIEIKINSNLRIKRRKVLPGITGLSQINYTGKKRKLIKKIDLDIIFIKNYTLFNYFKILFKTPYILIIRYLRNKSSIIK